MPAPGVTIQRYAPELEPAWNEFVRRARNGHFMLERGYMDYHADRFADESLLFRRGGRVLALLPAHRRDDALISHDGLPFAGLVVSPRSLHRDVRAAFVELGDYLRANGFRRLVFTPTPVWYHTAPFEDDLYVLRTLGARCTGMKLSAGFPGATPPCQSAQTASDLRRLDKKYPCAFRETDDVPGFWRHLERFLRRRFGASPVHTADEMALLKSRFPAEIRLLLAETDEVLAGVILYLTTRAQRAQYVFRTNEHRTRISARLRLHAASHPPYLRAWHDLGTSMDPRSGRLDDGVLLSKEVLGARGTIVQTWTWDIS